MSFGNIIGQILQQGMAGQSRARLEHSVGPEGLGAVPGLGDVLGAVLGGGQGTGGPAGGLGDLLGSVLGGASSRGAGGGGLGDVLGGALGGGAAAGGSGGGGLGDLLGGVLGGATRGGGGLGDLLGGVLGGGQGTQRSGNPLGSTGMAILATLAMAAFKNWSDSRGASLGLVGDAASAAPQELAELTSPAAEQLVLRAMLSAAKADGAVDDTEIQRIVGQIDDDGVSPEEKQFLLAELRKPLDLDALVAAVPGPAVAAQVYGASLLAIDLDTEAEAAYLRRLAAALGLDAATVARLHQLTGAPAV